MLLLSQGISLLATFPAIVYMFVSVGLFFSTAVISPYVRTFEKYCCYLLDVCPCVSIFVIEVLLVVCP